MASPDRQENNETPERGELHKNTQLVFHRIDPNPLNVEGIKPAADAFSQVLEQSKGKAILYREGPAFTLNAAERSRIVTQHHGLVDPILGEILREFRVPTVTQDTLNQLKQAIEHAGLRSVETGLVSPIHVLDLFFGLELERLKARRPFIVEYESHSDDKVQQILDLTSRGVPSQMTNIQLWEHSQLGLLADNQRRRHETKRKVSILRAPDIVDDLTRLTQDVSQGENKGVVFIPFREITRTVVDAARKNFYENAAIDVVVTSNGLEQSPESLIQDALENGVGVPDELLVQDFLDTVIVSDVLGQAVNRGKLVSFMQNCEKIVKASFAIARSFSLAEMDEMARSKKDLLEIVRAHPLGAPLLPYISRFLI